MMIAITSDGKSSSSKVSEVFGRCHYFIIFEVEKGKAVQVRCIENLFSEQQGHTGITVAQSIVEKGVNAVVTGNIGPRALDVLKQFNVEVYAEDGIVKEVLQKFVEGKLEKLHVREQT